MQQRVFTNGVEIKDQLVKDRFIKNSGVPFTVPTAIDPEAIIRFLAPDTAVFGTSNMRFYVTKKGNQHLFYSIGSVQVASNRINGTLNNDIRGLLKYTAPLVPLPSTTGFAYVTKEVRVGYRDQSNMRVALLHYRLKRDFSGLANSEASGLLFNEFNEAAITTIGAGDTLAVQESSFMMPVQ
ncbi:hypothetical protein [Hymenobacter roseosalivarius]|uniref:hypothetical protein n=1 Tax=Hymenobacter roseosalivarius TaxID=89967 RepID=UPI0009FBC79D|nr:hypothetical protein [Hymenobacter roseosalivarius]